MTTFLFVFGVYLSLMLMLFGDRMKIASAEISNNNVSPEDGMLISRDNTQVPCFLFLVCIYDVQQLRHDQNLPELYPPGTALRDHP